MTSWTLKTKKPISYLLSGITLTRASRVTNLGDLNGRTDTGLAVMRELSVILPTEG